jgi:heme/copper-type cytochrome/quinol oxidase subunit 1
MPKLTILYLRAAFVHLLVGISFGAFMLTAKAVPSWGWAWAWFPSHIELMAYGWMMQFGLGIAFWALPRFLRAPKRGNERPAQVAWWLINAGVLLLAFGPQLGISWARAAGSLAQALAILLFAIHAWPRIKPLGQ